MSERPKEPGAGGPPVLKRVPAGGPAAGSAFAGRGLDAPEVTASAAIAAGLAAEGNLASESPLHLYYLACASQAAGRLVIGSELATYGLTFRKGVVEHGSSTWPPDDLGEFLVKRGLLRADQAADARELAGSLGGDLLAALVELRLIDPAARFQDLKEHGAGLVWRALATEAGTWRWEPGVAPPAYGFPLGSRWGLLCDAVRRLDAPGVQRRLGGRTALAGSRVGGRVDIAELKLNPQEARMAGLFDGRRTVEDLAAFHPSEADFVRRVALLLAETELLAFAPPRAPTPEAEPAEPVPSTPPPAAAPAPPPPAAKPAAPPPAAAAKPPPARPAPAPRPAPAAPRPAAPAAKPAAAPSQTVEALRATLERFRDSDHFQVLGVPKEADTARIKAAYFQIAKTYHPDAAPEGEGEEARKLRADVFARVGAAWAVLENEASRAAYLEELRTGGSAQVDIAAILKAEQVFEKVPPLVAARSYAEALARVNEALGLYPDEPEYAVWKAWVEFLLAPESQKRAQRMTAERAIESALAKSPKCGPAYLFLGRMAKLVGDATAAERHWKRGIAEIPDHAELIRELRFLKK